MVVGTRESRRGQLHPANRNTTGDVVAEGAGPKDPSVLPAPANVIGTGEQLTESLDRFTTPLQMSLIPQLDINRHTTETAGG